jgi:hypothetical protein
MDDVEELFDVDRLREIRLGALLEQTLNSAFGGVCA